MYVYSSPKECFVGGDFPRFGISQMFKFWYRLFFLGGGESSNYVTVQPLWMPRSKFQLQLLCVCIHFHAYRLYLYYCQRKKLCLQTVRKRFELVR